MTFLLDTNILVAYLRASSLYEQIENDLHLADYQTISMISVVSKGELMAFATKNNWGKNKKQLLTQLLDKLFVLDINASDNALFEMYATLDAFSQGRLNEKPLPMGISARNMGKNDLWIVATAVLAKATLITTDNDFDHLQGHYLDIIKYQSTGNRIS